MNQKHTRSLNPQTIIALCMLLFSGVLLQQIFTIHPVESRLLPVFSFILCAVSSLALLLKSVFGGGERASLCSLLFSKKECAVLVLLLLSWWLMDILGFYSVTFLFLMALSILMEGMLSPKALLRPLACNLIFTMVLYLCFSVLLQMSTPRGILL